MNADWKQAHGRDANINYSVAAGSPPAITVDGGFNGELTGQEDTDDPARAAHGTWWIAESQGAATEANGNANQRRHGEHEPADGSVRSGAGRGPAGAQA